MSSQTPEAVTGEQAELTGLVDAHFVGNGPYPLQLVCLTEDASDVECGETVTEVEPGDTWAEIEGRIAAHALACHAAPARERSLLVWAAELITSGQPSATVPSEGWAEGAGNWLASYTAHTAGEPQPQAAPKTRPRANVTTAGDLL